MYLRDLIKVDFGMITMEYSGRILDRSNWLVSEIKGIEGEKLSIDCKEKYGDLRVNAYIKLKPNQEISILEKIKSSSKVIGKTLNELVDTKIEDI